MNGRKVLVVALLAATAGCIQTQADDADANAPPTARDAAAPPARCTPPEVQPTGPSGGQSGVSNEPGSFTYGGQAAAKTAKEVFLWENPSSAARVTWGGQAGAGSLTLTLQDHCGKEVYRGAVAGATQQSGVTETTGSGEPGTWILTFEFTLYTGQMGLSITSE
ncbi:MAG TPA: hypothetical protein VFH78_02495 [Candidatus Thermoplasmatota archaeon]|nr:hypothetical protein [Candidatus Thermoplasmatota archaeon]